MRTASDFVELAREREGISYYKVAQHLKITPSRLIRVRSGDTSLTEVQAEKLAELCHEPAGVVYAEAKGARAKRTEVRRFWERVARSLAASLVLVIVGVFSPSQDARADGSRVSLDIHYAHWRRRLIQIKEAIFARSWCVRCA